MTVSASALSRAAASLRRRRRSRGGTKIDQEAALRIDWGTPGDAFNHNQVVGRVEGRFNLDVLRPHGVVQLDLSAGA